MSFLGKTYTYEKHEKFDEWARAVGVPEEKIQAVLAQKLTQKFEKNGDTYSITQTSPKGSKTTQFKSGVELEDVMGDDNIPIKTTYTVDGNTITQDIKTALGNATFKREFKGDNLEVTMTSNKYDGVAKRYYKA